ncbi:Der GTPase-activating protein YihI [Catenovulum agarivorans]|uniref:Der GTPase-activating protein YihI n=1 Tax=Catenovulum agarivorans TaxID=1172192 RepID=UPI00030E8E15|nr:Der GTPase-activating protein YihI [Catenovulum agarivorans]
MTRIKKSRKTGPIGQIKSGNIKTSSAKERKKQVRKGQKSGSRHSQAAEEARTGQTSNKDPRIGSTKAVSLVAPNQQPVEKITAKTKPIIKQISNKPIVEPTEAWLAELEQIENDLRLQDLMAQLDEGETLPANDQAYFNKKMARHQFLIEKLGLDTDEDDDALFDEFENSKYDFE